MIELDLQLKAPSFTARMKRSENISNEVFRIWVFRIVWFAFVNSPLGTNLRVLKKFLIASTHDEKELETLNAKVSGFLGIRVVDADNSLDTIYEIISVDPDTADLIKLGIKTFLIAELI